MRTLAIIVSYNFEHWIDRCLGSLQQSTVPVSILVIDNCSKDNTIKIIKEKYPEIRLIENKKNLGFGQANNIGMRIALEENYDAIFLLNQDAWIDKKTIETLTSIYKEYPDYGIISPVHLTGKGDKPDFGFSTYTGIKSKKEIIKLTGKVIETPFINAAFWMIPTHVLQITGGFSPIFYHYGEDKDFVNRIHYHGFRIGYVPSVFGFHDREQRKSNHSATLHAEKTYLLSEVANINYSFPKAFAYGILAGIKKSFQVLAHANIKDAIEYINISINLILHLPRIIKIRKETKHKYPNYIQS